MMSSPGMTTIRGISAVKIHEQLFIPNLKINEIKQTDSRKMDFTTSGPKVVNIGVRKQQESLEFNDDEDLEQMR